MVLHWTPSAKAIPQCDLCCSAFMKFYAASPPSAQLLLLRFARLAQRAADERLGRTRGGRVVQLGIVLDCDPQIHLALEPDRTQPFTAGRQLQVHVARHEVLGQVQAATAGSQGQTTSELNSCEASGSAAAIEVAEAPPRARWSLSRLAGAALAPAS